MSEGQACFCCSKLAAVKQIADPLSLVAQHAFFSLFLCFKPDEQH